MPVTHTNRKGQIFYLHQTKTRTGKPKCYFAMTADGPLAGSIPEEHEVY
jgi:hypothetical protein